MTTARLITWTAFLAVFAMAARVTVGPDTWWHLRTGETILETGEIPRTDSFSYTRAGEDWRIPGWLVQVPMAWLYRWGGPGALNLWVAAMVTLAFWFVHRAMVGGPFLKAFIIVLAATAAGVYWAARPYILTFLLAAVFLWILEDWRRGRADRLWWLPVLMVVWANGHGGFAAGVILWGVYLAGALLESFRAARETGSLRLGPRSGKLLAVGLAMLLAVAANPFGFEMLLYPFKTVSIEALQDFIQEWQSPNFHERQVWPFAAMIFLIFGAAGASKKGLSLEDFLLVSGWGFLGLLAGRNIALFALAGALVLARHAAPLLAGWSEATGVRLQPQRTVARPLSVVNWVLLLLIALAAGLKAWSVVPQQANRAAFEDFLPLGAVDFIEAERPPGRIFNTYNWGAYMLWALPEYPVFVDGRTDLYNDEVIGEWFVVVRGEEGWDRILDRWDVHLVLVEPGLPVVFLLEDAGWELLYEDDRSVVIARPEVPE